MSDKSIILESAVLKEKGDGIRFDLPVLGPHATGFVIRYDGKAYAYVNRCAHVPVELDWEHGRFFNMSHEWIICATHGAMYAPQNGVCVMGPCTGKSLTSILVTEENGFIYIHLDRF